MTAGGKFRQGMTEQWGLMQLASAGRCHTTHRAASMDALTCVHLCNEHEPRLCWLARVGEVHEILYSTAREQSRHSGGAAGWVNRATGTACKRLAATARQRQDCTPQRRHCCGTIAAQKTAWPGRDRQARVQQGPDPAGQGKCRSCGSAHIVAGPVQQVHPGLCGWRQPFRHKVVCVDVHALAAAATRSVGGAAAAWRQRAV